MTLAEYVEEIKLELTGNLINCELEDKTIEQIIKKALRELNRYLDVSRFITIPYAKCIDLTNSKVANVVKVYRTSSGMASDKKGQFNDPVQVQQWQLLAGGFGSSMYNLNDWVLNYASWNTSLQIRNSVSTDLAYIWDSYNKKLYINCEYDNPSEITLEYTPIVDNVEEITESYWIDILIRLCVALTKVTLGRIRTRYVQSNALITQDGDTLLSEGNNELETIRETLRVNSQMILPID